MFVKKDNIFFYALGAIKNVGYEAVSNIIKERLNGGEFTSINNFIKRIARARYKNAISKITCSNY